MSTGGPKEVRLGVPIERVQAPVLGGTALAVLGTALVLLIGYGPDRAAAAVALGLGVGLMLAIPIAASYCVLRIRTGGSVSDVRVGWAEVAVWASATILLWALVPWFLFSPHWDALSALYLTSIPLGIQAAGLVVFALGARAARAVRNRALSGRQATGNRP